MRAVFSSADTQGLLSSSSVQLGKGQSFHGSPGSHRSCLCRFLIPRALAHGAWISEDQHKCAQGGYKCVFFLWVDLRSSHSWVLHPS